MWAMTLGVEHKLPSLHLDDSPGSDALKLPTSAFLPQQDDFDSRKHRSTVIVQRTLVKYIDVFKHLYHKVTWHIPHEKSKEMNTKSHVVNLGVVEANPSSTSGTIDIMEHLSKYVPEKEDGQLHTLICNGDQLSVERMTHAKHARVRGAKEKSRMDGLLETPQEFHKEGLLLQVSRLVVCN